MARDEAPPFARGETYANGNLEILNAATGPYGLGGVNLEGKEYVFEPNSNVQESGYNQTIDPSGRPVRVKVVRNVSGVNLKPGRLARYKAETPYECHIDGYCHILADIPAGVVDEYLPAAGVPDQDLFFIVLDGPTSFVNQASPITTAVGSVLVPAATGASVTDDLAGRVALQDLSGATATLGHEILNQVGYADAVNSAASGVFRGVAHRYGK